MFGLLLFSGQTFMAQVLLELESRTTLYVETDGQTLLTQAEYADRYSRDNSFQASNAVTVAIRHLNAKATVSDTRQKATPKSLSKTRGPIVQISLTFSRPIFDVAFGIGSKSESCLVNGAVFANTGDRIHQRLAVGGVHAHVVRGNHRHVSFGRQFCQCP